MRNPLIAGNWKMYKTTEEAVSFAKEFAELYKADETDIRTAICAPFTQLAALKTAFAGTGIMLGAQNVHFADEGAYTGEISVKPSLKGKMTGIAYRVPTADVSVVDLNVRLKKPATYAEVCAKVKEASETYMKGVIEYVDDEVVSSDFIGDPCTSIFDAREGFQLNDRMFKFISFYDNEYGYSSKIVELIKHMASVDNK